ncbi:MAG: hypothetical protein ABGZ36_18650, partial [Actinomycetota bacterium]
MGDRTPDVALSGIAGVVLASHVLHASAWIAARVAGLPGPTTSAPQGLGVLLRPTDPGGVFGIDGLHPAVYWASAAVLLAALFAAILGVRRAVTDRRKAVWRRPGTATRADVRRAASAKALRRRARTLHQDFPLTAHRNGQFCKKIRGQLVYFGSVNDPDAALKRYLRECDFLLSGSSRQEARIQAASQNNRAGEGLDVDELVNRFLGDKLDQVEQGQLEHRSYLDYERTGRMIIKAWKRNTLVSKLTSGDFARLKKSFHAGRALKSVKGHITRTKVMFNHAFDTRMLEVPAFYGQQFHVSQTV